MGRAKIHQMKLGCRLLILIFQGKDHEDPCQAKMRAKHGELSNTPPVWETGKQKVQP
ncbi:hypothetical protein BVRB_5g113240 [Beta vulgaris subsp. vulgaris]|nr:hypothetical protein BVRB_5g113240 [Beta vulgaris subsp. vulgaris]